MKTFIVVIKYDLVLIRISSFLSLYNLFMILTRCCYTINTAPNRHILSIYYFHNHMSTTTFHLFSLIVWIELSTINYMLISRIVPNLIWLLLGWFHILVTTSATFTHHNMEPCLFQFLHCILYIWWIHLNIWSADWSVYECFSSTHSHCEILNH